MSKVEYSTKIGQYRDDVCLDVTLSINRGVTKEDYEILRTAFNTIEDLAYKYQHPLTKATDGSIGDKLESERQASERASQAGRP